MEHEERIPVVGIGASAGGVEALQALFRRDAGAAACDGLRHRHASRPDA